LPKADVAAGTAVRQSRHANVRTSGPAMVVLLVLSVLTVLIES
jgi:hypothetical protein